MFRKIALFWILFMTVLAAQDRTPVITIYNENLALVRETRILDLNKSGDYAFPNISDQIILTSVHMKPLSNASSFSVIEQNFDYDLASVQKILAKSLDAEIEVVSGDKVYRGKLLAYQNNLITLQTKEGLQIIKWGEAGEINLNKLPDNLIAKPTLTWKLQVNKKGKVPVELSYLTAGFQWEVSYVGNYNPDKNTLEVNSWADIKNNTAVSFPESKLYLMAGDINRAGPEFRGGRVMMETLTRQKSGFKEQKVFEYHMYELNTKTDLKSNQEKQIAFLNPTTVPVIKEFQFDATRDNAKIGTYLKFKNIKEQGLGIPLPKGIFRVYQTLDNVQQFIGEDRIEHTPRNEEINLKLGTSFDLAGERNIVNSQKISNRSVQETIEVELRNNKEKEDVVIHVHEHPYGREWKILKSNYKFEKKSQNEIIFKIPVPANSAKKLTYMIKREW